jgi:hypothetical protein
MTAKNPGIGSIEFARQFTEGLTQEQALPVIKQLMAGDLHDASDKRVKRCDYCGYLWRDVSLRNTKRTCCEECKTGIKSIQRQEQRANKELLNPEPKSRKHRLIDDYIWWLEYPFWINEYSMIKIGWKYEKPSGGALLDFIEAKDGLYGKGNRRKTVKHVDYHGDIRDQF